MPLLYPTLATVAILRLAELVHGRRNAARLLVRGGQEVGAAHYPLFILLHGGWFVAIAAFAEREPRWPALLALFGLLQVARWWVIWSLGPYWTTRIITMAGTPLVRRGPYRWLRHPNYLIVAAEIAVLPSAFGAVWLAVVFSLLNAALLSHRIGVENGALTTRRHLDGSASARHSSARLD